MKDKLDRKIMREFSAINAKTYSNLIDNKDEDKAEKSASQKGNFNLKIMKIV